MKIEESIQYLREKLDGVDRSELSRADRREYDERLRTLRHLERSQVEKRPGANVITVDNVLRFGQKS